jgi:hypothetical protein
MYLANRRDNGWIFDVLLSRLGREEAPNVRANVARALGTFAYTDRERALTALRNALLTEKDPEVREAIEQRIRQVSE